MFSVGRVLEGRLSDLWCHPHQRSCHFLWALPHSLHPLLLPFPLPNCYSVHVRWHGYNALPQFLFVLRHPESILFFQFIFLKQPFLGTIAADPAEALLCTQAGIMRNPGSGGGIINFLTSSQAEFPSLCFLHPSLVFIVIIISLHCFALSIVLHCGFFLILHAWVRWRNRIPMCPCQHHCGIATMQGPQLHATSLSPSDLGDSVFLSPTPFYFPVDLKIYKSQLSCAQFSLCNLQM